MPFVGKIQLAEASKRASIIALVILGLLQNNISDLVHNHPFNLLQL
jgi:hypothetical protein